ncbi:MAG: helix-turn-helix domain-containing protein [Alphaproteobacteria bacterium]
MTETPVQSSSVPALEKGMGVLEFLADQNEPVSLQEISSGLHRSRGELYRMVTWLVEQQYIIRLDGKDKYVLGERIGRLFRRQAVAEDVISATMPLMTGLSQSISAACHLSIRAKWSSVVIASTDSPDFYGVSAKVGATMPIWESPAGACMIHDLSDSEQVLLLERVEEPWRNQFGEETRAFAKNQYVERFETAGPGIMEFAFANHTNSRLVSAVTIAKVVSSKDHLLDVVSRLRDATVAV